MSKLQYFYATKNDVLTVTAQVESEHPIKYVRYGHTTTLPPESFLSAAAIPRMGVASRPSSVNCEKYLVCEVNTVINPSN
jgi:hypothetical protein